jgi:hypothetical protein
MKYRVWLRSSPGMWTRYSGHVDVNAKNPEEAIERARDKLHAGAFPNRSRDSWSVDKVEIKGDA